MAYHFSKDAEGMQQREQRRKEESQKAAHAAASQQQPDDIVARARMQRQAKHGHQKTGK